LAERAPLYDAFQRDAVDADVIVAVGGDSVIDTAKAEGIFTDPVPRNLPDGSGRSRTLADEFLPRTGG
jgi:alcohol dehydrogenase class IV